ncbi:hypothetical protein [Pseudomonas sp. D(2018)]|uniref:hypothetical protein n=1 Tax=Pseudomonas sp. D(2018) TaxID=2502238 RepID=UPI0010F4E101|nr:hypothetical protein [Pseudomonas sp. D(2018)]
MCDKKTQKVNGSPEVAGVAQEPCRELEAQAEEAGVPVEYSEEFAQRILEAARGEFFEIDADDFIADLERQLEMLEARERDRKPE